MAASLFGCGRSTNESNTIHLTIASSHTTSIAWIGTMHTLVVPETNKRLEVRGSPFRIRWTEAYGGSLYKYEHTLEAIEIGLTDMGWVGTLWELSKMPLQNITYFTPFSTEDYYAIFDIYNELHRTLPAMRDAWTAQNQRFLGANALDSYHLMTRLPEDVQDVLSELGPQYSRGVADEVKRRYEGGLARMRDEGASIKPLPLEEKQKWIAAMPDIATKWAEATEARGFPAGEVLRAYMEGIRARGGQPLRDWDRPS